MKIERLEDLIKLHSYLILLAKFSQYLLVEIASLKKMKLVMTETALQETDAQMIAKQLRRSINVLKDSV